MSESTTTIASSASVYTTHGFWERLWRTAGLQFVGLIVVASRVLLSRSPATRAGW